MDCEYFNEYISPYVDGMVDRKDKEALEEHLSQCPRCIAILHQTREIIGRVDELDEEVLPSNFHQGLFDRLEKGRKHMKPINWLKATGAIAAVIVLLFSVKAIGSWSSMDKNPSDGLIEQKSDGNEEKSMIAMDEAEDSVVEDSDSDNMAENKLTLRAKEDRNEEDVKGIQSESVEVYVQDVCITPQTLQFMAANNGFELLEMGENSAILGVKNDEQRVVLYEELSKMGEVKETGENIGGNQVKVVIISVMSEAEGD